MKKMIVFAAASILFSGCAGNAPSHTEDRHMTDISNLNRSKEIYTNHDKMLAGPNPSNEAIMSNLSTIDMLVSDQRMLCAGESRRSLYASCVQSQAVIASVAAEMKIKTAGYFAGKGNKDAAKDIYRGVITTYTGDIYKGYVKQAEFGLEDLKK